MHITFKIAVAGQGVFVFRPQSSVILEQVDFSIHPENEQYKGWLHILWKEEFIKCELLLSNEKKIILQDEKVT